MRCTTPYRVRNPRKVRFHNQDMYIDVPCGKCPDCQMRRSLGWVFRLQEEEKHSKSASFVTYTYDDYNVPVSKNGYLTLDKTHHQKFMKSLRKRLKKEGYEDKLIYYQVGEYGTKTQRPHYHSILFNLPIDYVANPHWMDEIWARGRVQVDQVSRASISYVTGYMYKPRTILGISKNDDRIPEYSAMSKGIGLKWITSERIKFMKENLDPYIITEGGKKQPIPRIYKDKMFTEKEREIIAKKSLEYLEENDIFEQSKDHIDYLQLQSRLRQKKAAQKRTKI